MNNDANLYERKYLNIAGELNSDMVNYWTDLIGKSGVNYIKKKWPSVLSDKCEYRSQISDFKYSKLKAYYASHEIIENEDIVKHYKNKNLGCFFYDILTLAYHVVRQKNNCGKIKIGECVYFSYLDAVYDKLILAAARSIILDMNLWEKRHPFVGTAEEAYLNYCELFLSKREYRLAFYNKYPAVFRSVLEIVIFASDNFNMLVERINKDKNAIRDELCGGKCFHEVTGLSVRLSDSHCGGNCVQKIKLDNGWTIVYKPHSIKNETAYQQIVSWFGKNCGINMYSYKYIEQEEYGWTEYVCQMPCKDQEEVKRYYSRIGIHAFVCFLLNTSDIHAENLIAHGEYPVIVDMETIVSPVMSAGTDSLDNKIKNLIQQSVLHSGLFPFYIWSRDQQAGVDISAINGRFGQIYPVRVPAVVNPFRIDMKINYVNAVSNSSRNLAYAGNDFMIPGEFEKQILLAFKKSYQIALDNKDWVLRMFNRLSNMKIRLVLRNSQQYAMLLSSSFHPQLTTDEINRQMLFYGLYGMEQGCNEIVLESEVKDLLQGDIPYFYYYADNRNLYNSKNEKIENFFKGAIIEQLLERFQSMDEKDMSRQCIYIQVSLGMTKYAELKCRYREFAKCRCKAPVTKERSVALAAKYGDFLINTAVYNKEKTDVNWVGIKVQGGNRSDWHLTPLNLYFYEGKSGVAFFLHVLSTLVPGRYERICDLLDQSFFQHTNQMLTEEYGKKEVNTGAYYGEASILYLYELCYSLHKKEKYIKYCEKQAGVIKKYFKNDRRYDFLSGNAGAIITIINLYDMTGKEKYLSLALEMGEYLLQHSTQLTRGIGWRNDVNPYFLAGLSHGNSGFALAFAYLYNWAGGKRYLDVICNILAYEDTLYNAHMNNWIDLRGKESDEYKDISAWCHGAAGILLARLKLLEFLKDTELEKTILKDMKHAAEKLLKMQLLKGNCLCHGNLGNINILEAYGKQMNRSDAKVLSSCMFERVIGLIEKDKVKFTDVCEQYNPGIMIGATGIYYGILKHCMDFLPQILLLDI